MLINYIFMLILSIHLTTTVSVNRTSTLGPETQNIQNSTSVLLAKDDKQKIKSNEKKIKLLNRGIANTSNVNEPKNDLIATGKIPTEAGVSKINNQNDTTSIVVSGSKVNSGKAITSTTSTAAPPIVGNSTQTKTHFNQTMGNKKTTTVLLPLPKSSINVKSSTTSTSTSTTTTTTTTSTTTTTTPKPKKPTITYSLADIPDSDKVNIDSSSSGNKFPSDKKSSDRRLSAEEPQTPHVQPSQEFGGVVLYRNHRDYIIPIVSIIFAVPILMGMVIVAYRRFRDFWSTRHYRRMDFLVDGMYND